jgi:D-alanine-D-alanine ligase-like ATP-grasp enzyme
MISAYQKDFDGTLEEFAINKSKKVFEKFASPWIVKSLTEDLNVAIHVAKTFSELIDAIVDCTKHGKSILVEEFIFGKNVSVHSVSKFRGEDIYHFPPIEKKNDIVFSPGRFSLHEKEKIIESTKKIFSHVNAKQYLKLDFVLHKSGVIYLKQIDFSPNLDENSCFHKSCESVGTKAHSAIDHILEEALK